MVDARRSLSSEAFFARVEYYTTAEVLAPGLIHRARSPGLLPIPTFLIESGARHLQLKGLSIEHLVVVKARRCSIEADTLSSHNLVIANTLAVLLPDIGFPDARNLVLDTEDSILVVNVLALLALCHNLLLLATLTIKNANSRALC